MHIMDIMDKTISEPRPELSPYAPKIFYFKIDVDQIGTVIGPGGKTIRHIIEQTDVQIDIEEDGTVVIASPAADAADKAKLMIEQLTEKPQVGKAYKGKAKRVKDFGVFVEFLPGKEGMVHISELDVKRTAKVTDVVKEGDEIDVVVKSIGQDGKIALSRKMFLQKQENNQDK